MRQAIQILQDLREVLQKREQTYLKIEQTYLQELSLADPSAPTRRVPKMRHSPALSDDCALVRHGAIVKTGITAATCAALPSLPETFNVHDVHKAMIANGYRFG